MTSQWERVEHFVSMMGDCYDAARFARLPFSVELDDGSVVVGVPSQKADADGEDEFDDSGTRNWLELGSTVVMTARVRRYSVAHPDHPANGGGPADP